MSTVAWMVSIATSLMRTSDTPGSQRLKETVRRSGDLPFLSDGGRGPL